MGRRYLGVFCSPAEDEPGRGHYLLPVQHGTAHQWGTSDMQLHMFSQVIFIYMEHLQKAWLNQSASQMKRKNKYISRKWDKNAGKNYKTVLKLK